MHEHLRDRLLLAWAGVVTRRPVAILVVAGLLAVAAVGVTAARLTFQSDRNALVSQELAWNQRFRAWMSAFSSNNDLIVVVDAGAGREEARRVVDELGPRLAALPEVRAAVWGYDRGDVHPRTLRLLPMDAFETRLAEMEEAAPLLASPTPGALVAEAVRRMRAMAAPPAPETGNREGADAAAIADFAALIDAFTGRLQLPEEEPFDLASRLESGDAEGWQYFATPNERFLIIRVSPRPEPGSLTPARPAIDAVRREIAAVRAAHPSVELGLTGGEVVEADETAAATRDSTVSSIAATLLIAVLLVVAFHSVRMPVLLVATLLVGIAWSFGFLTLAIGHLQVISVVFAVILLGLGIDFGIHLATRYERVRHDHPDLNDESDAGFRAALGDTFTAVGPGVVTGAITTAVAFGSTLFTDFTGVAEMGLVAGVGVLLCLAAMFSVFPAALRLLKARHVDVVPMGCRRVHLFDERWLLPFARRPRVTLAVAGVVVAASVAAATQLRFDYNLLALLPRGVESVEWQERIVGEGEQSIYFAVSIVESLEEARRRAAAMRALPTVGSLGGIGYLFPENRDAKLARISEMRDRLGPAMEAALATGDALSETDGPELVPQLAALRLGVAMQWPRSPEALRPALAELLSSIDTFLAQARTLDEAERAARLAALQRDYAGFRRRMATRIDAALDPSPLRVTDLPAPVIEPYVAEVDGEARYALEVFAQPAATPGGELEPARLRRFVEDVRAVDPAATGVVVQIYESGSLIWRSYLFAGVCALVAVFVLILLDLQRLSDALLALVPVTTGFALTFGVMQFVGVRLNPANIIVLPLMFGIGVDAGVHVIHRYRQDPVTPPLGLTAGTGKGIVLTSLTTMIGFACMIPASHRGIASLGFVMTTGIALTLLACCTVMPAILSLRRVPRDVAVEGGA